MSNIFFLGAGNMGGAILSALEHYSVLFYEPNDERAACIKAERVASIEEGISKADIMLLCVKPQVFREITGKLQGAAPVVVSIMAGVSLAELRKALPFKTIVRTMPNIAVTAKKGTVAIATDGVPEDILQKVEQLFSPSADTFRVSESQMDAVTGLSGSGPAFVFQFAEALAMGGVKAGLPRDMAVKLALSTMNGSVQMLKKSKLCSSELTASVCSPAGTTIAGLQELENKAFRGIVMAAVEAAAKRSAELGK
jgi:pyrroline-5-carboxylate reductase